MDSAELVGGYSMELHEVKQQLHLVMLYRLPLRYTVSNLTSRSQTSREAFYIYLWVGVEPGPLLLWQCIGLLYQPWVIDGDDSGADSGMNETSREACG
jgi:hypothetical protein